MLKTHMEAHARSAPVRAFQAALGPGADDQVLARALIARHPDAPRVVWTRFSPLVQRIVERALGAQSEVDDVVQEVFECVFKKAGSLRNPDSLRAFISSVAKMTARYEIRRSSRRRRAPMALAEMGLDLVIYSSPESHQALSRLWGLLERIDAAWRPALVLRLVHGCSLTHIAAMLGVSLSTAKRRLARGLGRLRPLLARDHTLAEYLGARRRGFV